MTDRPELISHIGWDLHRAASRWKRLFHARMVKAGYPVFAEARAVLLPLISHDGTPQSEIVKQAGMSKQAVQQHLDDLVADGLAERTADPSDSRRKLVRFTDRGLEMLEFGNRVKRELEGQVRSELGEESFNRLRVQLHNIVKLLDDK